MIDDYKETGIEQILSERELSYGDFDDNAKISTQLNDVFMDCKNKRVLSYGVRCAIQNIFNKLARIGSGDITMNLDSARDVAGYAKLLYKTMLKDEVRRKREEEKLNDMAMKAQEDEQFCSENLSDRDVEFSHYA